MAVSKALHHRRGQPSALFGGLGEVLSTLAPGGKRRGRLLVTIAADTGPGWLRAGPNP